MPCHSEDAAGDLNRNLDPDVLSHVFSFLTCNDIVLSVKPLNRAFRGWVRNQRGFAYNVIEAAAFPVPVWALQQLNVKTMTKHQQQQLVIAAARGGDLAVLKWLKAEIGPACFKDERICEAAADKGHVQLLQWARWQGCPLNRHDVCVSAARKGDLQVLRCLLWGFNPFDRSIDICTAAAGGGHLSVLQFARRKRCHWDTDTCMAAAAGGHLQLLQWAREQGCPWDSTTCAAAARRGHLQLLQWARENGCPWDRTTCAAAARGGHLHVLQWARENGCPWDADTLHAAARELNFQVLQWAKDHGCPVARSLCYVAIYKRSGELLEWALDNGCPWDPFNFIDQTYYMYFMRRDWTQSSVGQVILRRGLPLPPRFYLEEAQLGNLDFLRSSHEGGVALPSSFVEIAARYGHDAVVEWAAENGYH